MQPLLADIMVGKVSSPRRILARQPADAYGPIHTFHK